MRIFTVDQAMESGVIKIDGKKGAFTNFLGPPIRSGSIS
jgi:hypothetical protein